MKRKNGFTLIELLAVIMIVGIIGLITIPKITKFIKESKNKLYDSQIKMIQTSAKKWSVDNINKLSETETVYLDLSELLSSGYIEQNSLKDPRNQDQDMNGCIVIKYDDSYSGYEYEYQESTCNELQALYSDATGAPIPELTDGMIPVKWNGSEWIKADVKEKWYDYAAKEWANAVTVTSTNRANLLSAAAGTVIPMSDINTMWVWIPRYKYAIPTGTGARSINITFESKTTAKSTGNAVDINYLTHPAFTFGSTEVNGIWVGKFETTGSIVAPTILPNTTSLRSQTIKAMYDASRAMQNNTTYGTSNDGNIHMAKNSEWGAVAYLSHSQYGINSEIYKNNSSSFYTGRSGGNVGGSQVLIGEDEYISAGFYTYDGKCATTTTLAPGIATVCTAINNNLTDKTLAYKASTTGNIYGIYDISGGAWEYVMGIYRPTDSTSVTDSSGFGATTTIGTLPTSEYWDRYTTTTDATSCSGGVCYGNALSETSGWYSDNASFVNASSPWSARGGFYSFSTVAGAYFFNSNNGSASSNGSFRIVQMKP